ncbi:DUF262 domain-containing protein [Anoxybacillus ayderensis]|uniref:DUF262 domain-containing protein n=1 Tax=Anoxybacillus ayderensis TaxID=265546 RepID=UPI002E1BED73|nr:DUF262 domain-containing protein [Anoxybacillus ayderensis]
MNKDTQLVEKQIKDEQKTVDYDTREFTIEIMVQKYLDGVDENKNEIFVPDYQREFVWDQERQSKYIESLILGLPIPLMFIAENNDGRFEIVDGSQRIRTLAAFLNNDLELTGLEKLSRLNGWKFSDLEESRKRKFKNLPIRTIVLSEDTTETVKKDMFERINRGSDLLTRMESRRGIYWGEFNDFIFKVCGEDRDFLSITPVHESLRKRQEHEELILRFFALSEHYPNYKPNMGIARFLDRYFIEKNKNFKEQERKKKYNDFKRMVNFVKNNFPNGFAKSDSLPQVSRVYFEAISVGVHLALEEAHSIKVDKNELINFLKSREFMYAVSGKYHTHTPERLLERINLVKNFLLKYGS